MYHPQVEAISPTGPEATGERDDLKAIKEDLLKKITKVDREILKAESQIVKLKKKQQELEDAANKPFSDSSDEMERPKNQSVAQVIYADNRVSLGRFYVNRPSIEFIQLASLCRLLCDHQFSWTPIRPKTAYRSTWEVQSLDRYRHVFFTL